MMNLKGFKKVSEDKNSATLEHPKGHRITVVVSKLTPIEKEALKRLDMCKPERLSKDKEKFAKGGDVKMMEKGGDPAPDDTGSDDASADGQKQPPVVVNNITPRDASQAPVAGGQAYGVAGNTSTNPAAIDPVLQEAKGYEQEAAAKSGVAAQNAKDKAAMDAQYQQRQLDIQKNAQEMQGHTDEFNKFAKENPIKPNAYVEDMKTPAKITNAIGMLLAGVGGGGAQAMDFLNKQIDRNVAAQENNFQHQGTIWHAYEALYHDKNIATNMAKATAAEMLANQISQTADRYGTAQAQAQKNIALGQLGIKHSQEIGLAAARKTALERGELPQNPGPAGLEAMKQRGTGASDSWGDENANAVPQPQEENIKPVSILAPGAEDRYKSLQYGPSAKVYPEITKQYNQAVQSEKALQAIHEKFPQLKEEATYSGNIASKINPHGVAAVTGALGAGIGALGGGAATGPLAGVGAYPGALAGASVGAGIGEGGAHAAKAGLEMTGGQQQVKYEADKSAITKVIAAALRGANVNSEQIQEVVDSNTPSVWDSKETYHKKMKNIEDFIKQNTETGLLKTWGLSKE